MSDTAHSYHDVVVYVNGSVYRIARNYAYVLSCTKAGGWNLWYKWNGTERLIGGEFNGDDFCIEVAGIAICGTRHGDGETEAHIGGWTGEVRA